MYYTLRIDADPTSWELTYGLEHLPAPGAPKVLPVFHPLRGNLLLSHRSVGSTVLLAYQLPINPDGTRPDGYAIPEPGGALYLPSPTGPDVASNPPNLYPLASKAERAILQEKIMAAMVAGDVFPWKLAQGEIVINGAKLPFAILCPQNLPRVGESGRRPLNRLVDEFADE